MPPKFVFTRLKMQISKARKIWLHYELSTCCPWKCSLAWNVINLLITRSPDEKCSFQGAWHALFMHLRNLHVPFQAPGRNKVLAPIFLLHDFCAVFCMRPLGNQDDNIPQKLLLTHIFKVQKVSSEKLVCLTPQPHSRLRRDMYLSGDDSQSIITEVLYTHQILNRMFFD